MSRDLRDLHPDIDDAPSVEGVAVPRTTALPRTAKRPRASKPSKHSATRDGAEPLQRKSTYVVRRQEIDELTEHVHALEQQLDALRHSVGLPTTADHAAVHETRDENFDVEERIIANDLYLARVSSLVTNELLELPANPLSTYLHLPVDMAERRRILRSVLDVKLRRGIEFVTSRLHHLDPTVPYKSEERFTAESDAYHYTRAESTPFPNFQTAQQLFDVFVKFLYNLEISVTEGLGQMTLREDSEGFDPTIWNHRIVTVAEDVGCTEELNFVGFAGFFHDCIATQSPAGIVVLDVVNVDELYPYLPHERTCKDVQTAHLVYEVPVPGSHEPLVVLQQCYLIVQLPPQFELAPEVLAQLQRHCSRWPDYIIKYLSEYVVPDTAN